MEQDRSGCSGDPPCLFERKPHRRTCKFKVALEGHVGRLVFGLDMLDNFKSLDPKGVAGSEGRERGGGLSEAIPPARDVQCAPGTREERTCRGL